MALGVEVREVDRSREIERPQKEACAITTWYGPYSYGLYSYGLHRYGPIWPGPYIVMALCS